jgi:hypothetical protein
VAVGVGVFALRPSRRAATILPPPVPASAAIVTTSTLEPSAVPSIVLAPPSSTGASSTVAAPPSASVPWWVGKAPDLRPHGSAHPVASAPACHVVSFFDADGNKHFKQECP